MVEHTLFYFEVHRVICNRQLIYFELTVGVLLHLLRVLKTDYGKEVDEDAEAGDVKAEEFSLSQILLRKNARSLHEEVRLSEALLLLELVRLSVKLEAF